MNKQMPKKETGFLEGFAVSGFGVSVITGFWFKSPGTYVVLHHELEADMTREGFQKISAHLLSTRRTIVDWGLYWGHLLMQTFMGT